MSFGRDLGNFMSDWIRFGNDSLRRGIVRTGRRLVELSPVDTGRYVMNHRVGIGAPDETVALTGFRLPGGRVSGGVRGPGPRGPAITATMAGRLKKRFESVALRAKAGDDIFFSNNVAYAQKIEDGHSTQAPNGVYSRVFDHVEEDFSGGVSAELF